MPNLFKVRKNLTGHERAIIWHAYDKVGWKRAQYTREDVPDKAVPTPAWLMDISRVINHIEEAERNMEVDPAVLVLKEKLKKCLEEDVALNVMKRRSDALRGLAKR